MSGQQKFVFLFFVRSPCGDLKKIAKSSPKGTDISDGDLVYYWETQSRFMETAVDRAIKKCLQLRDKSNLDWMFDDEFSVSSGDVKTSESFHDLHTMGDELTRLGLW